MKIAVEVLLSDRAISSFHGQITEKREGSRTERRKGPACAKFVLCDVITEQNSCIRRNEYE